MGIQLTGILSALSVLANPAVKAEYDALESELSVARQAIALRVSMGLTQGEFAKRLGMERSELESGMGGWGMGHGAIIMSFDF